MRRAGLIALTDVPQDRFLYDAARHREGAVYVFADGHAKWLRPATTFQPANLWRR